MDDTDAAFFTVMHANLMDIFGQRDAGLRRGAMRGAYPESHRLH